MISTNEGKRDRLQQDSRQPSVVQQGRSTYDGRVNVPLIDNVARNAQRHSTVTAADRSSNRLHGPQRILVVKDWSDEKDTKSRRTGDEAEEGDVFSIVSDSTSPNCRRSSVGVDDKVVHESSDSVNQNRNVPMNQKKLLKQKHETELNNAALEYAIAAGYDPKVAIPTKTSKSKKKGRESSCSLDSSSDIVNHDDCGGYMEKGETKLDPNYTGPPPKRPLSAYNLFFHLERQRILEEESLGFEDATFFPYTVEDLVQFTKKQDKTGDNTDVSESDPNSVAKPKRKHRKTHGKISFTELARTVASRWRALSDQSKNMFHGYFQTEMNRYKIEYEKWSKANSHVLQVKTETESQIDCRTQTLLGREAMENLDDQKLLQLAGINSIESLLASEGNNPINTLPVDFVRQRTPTPLLPQQPAFMNEEELESLSYIKELELRKLELQQEIEMYKSQMRTRRSIPQRPTYPRGHGSNFFSRPVSNYARQDLYPDSLVRNGYRSANEFVNDGNITSRYMTPSIVTSESLSESDKDDGEGQFQTRNFKTSMQKFVSRNKQNREERFTNLCDRPPDRTSKSRFHTSPLIKGNGYRKAKDTSGPNVGTDTFRMRGVHSERPFIETEASDVDSTAPDPWEFDDFGIDGNNNGNIDAIAMADQAFELATSTLLSPEQAFDENYRLLDRLDPLQEQSNTTSKGRTEENVAYHPQAADNLDQNNNDVAQWQHILVAQQQKIFKQQQRMKSMINLLRESNNDSDHLILDDMYTDGDYSNMFADF